MKKHLTLLLLAASAHVWAQQPAKKDKAVYLDQKPGYYETDILKGIEAFEKEAAKPAPPRKRFKNDFSKTSVPSDYSLYKTVWYNKPVSQGNTNTCWCFAATSFYESEAKRLSGVEVKLSEMWPVYWEYVERAKLFVAKRGDMVIGEGSETNAVTRSYKQYGAVPYEAFPGLKEGQQFFTHAKLIAEIETYFKSVKASGAWNEETVVNTVKSILNYHIGTPPTLVKWKGKDISPVDFLKNILKINMDEYVDVMSTMSIPYYTRGELKVSDNWWHSEEYYNIPLDEYVAIVKQAIQNGKSIAIGGDTSEPGFDPATQAAVVPTFDVPSDYIDESARQMRFNNGSSTDDHAMHIVGYTEKDGKTWFLVKDSGSGSRNCDKNSNCFGHYFMHEDYLKLKILSFTVHRDAMKGSLEKFGKVK